MYVGMAYQFQDFISILVGFELHFQLVVNVSEPLDPTIFPGGNLSARIDYFQTAPSQFLVIIQLIITGVLSIGLLLINYLNKKKEEKIDSSMSDPQEKLDNFDVP